MSRLTRVGLFITLIFLVPLAAKAAPAKIVEKGELILGFQGRYEFSDQEKKSQFAGLGPVAGLQFSSLPISLFFGRDTEGKSMVLCEVKALYTQPLDWNLVLTPSQRIPPTQTKVRADRTRELTWLIPLREKKTLVQFFVVSPIGDAQFTSVQVTVDAWEELSRLFTEGRGSPWSFSFLLGTTSISYSQTDVPSLNQIDLTGKVGASFAWGGSALQPRPWSMGLISYFTIFPLNTTPDSSYRAWYFGANLRIGYTWFLAKGWALGLHGGAYYLSLFPTAQSYGFQNLSGPQLYPTLAKKWSDRHASTIYFKFSPVNQNFAILGIENREIAGGVSHSWQISQKWALLSSLDVSQVQLAIDSVTIQDRTIGLSVGARY